MKIGQMYRNLHNFQSLITLLLLFIATNCFLHKNTDIFMVHLEKLKCQFNGILVVMVTRNMWFVGKLPLRAYLHSWHSANIWNVFLKFFIKKLFSIGS